MNMTRRPRKDIDPVKYIKIRLKMLRDERAKNNDPNTHMIIDKAIHELTIVLDLLTRKVPNNH